MIYKNKKGISPLIATVLIIGFTIVLAALVITWGTKLFKGTVQDTQKTADFSKLCSTGIDVEYNAKYGDATTIVTAENKAMQGIEGFLFVAKGDAGTKSFLAVKNTIASGQLENVKDGADGSVQVSESDKYNLGAFGTKEYTLEAISAPADLILGYTTIDVRPIVKSGSDYQVCPNEQTVNIIEGSA